jgi:anti-sigma factor RsiW
MSEHDVIREYLSLAAAGALDAAEEQRLARHLRECSECAKEFEGWQFLAGELRRLPTPQAPAALVERVRAQVAWQLAEEKQRRSNAWLMIFLVLFAWTLTLASWPVVRLLTSGLIGWFDPSFGHTWIDLAGYTALVWLTGGVAAATLAVRRRRERRMA